LKYILTITNRNSNIFIHLQKANVAISLNFKLKCCIRRVLPVSNPSIKLITSEN
jgi:hypothetical protein